jgi:NTP pyrophosphatase (non-canonical NTP hydrolase)
MMNIKTLIEESHKTAIEKGWWNDTTGNQVNVGNQFSNFHSEISEAWEEYRKGKGWDEIYYRPSDGKPEGIPVEFADLLIRIFDTCGNYGIPLERALTEKLAFNKKRPMRHGGKKA